ncbi:MAG TPA: S16 family serine protease, partial [Candidatus Nanoarchaeia archaeon]|nr:S16 family serine protease [Candidatus Nanoarchaeia archaeon]
MRLLPILFCILLCTSAAYAQTNSIKLLAVIEDSKQGTIVDLHLDIIPGSGRVFLETYPLSQIDTQISLRIAKTIACQTSEVYCLNKDFIYSVNAQSPVVAGPSAGAAIAVLTMATLKNTNIDPNIVITGTINSGGVIGPVGGVKEKIKAAVDVGVTKVLIPRGEENATQIIEYGKEIGVIVQEVATIDEAYEAITGIRQEYAPLVVDESYQETMRAVAEDLCARNKELIDSVPVTSGKTYNFSISLSEQAKKLFDEEKYYSAASRCFGSNVQARQLLLNDSKTFASDVESIETQLAVLEQGLNQTRLTKLGDLETAMIIRERIEDARKNLEEFKESKSIQDLAYAIERTQSAYTWKKFFGFSDTAIDETKLKESCTLKIEEVKELYNYIAIYSPILVKETKRELEKAESYLETEDYALCLFKASKSKA